MATKQAGAPEASEQPGAVAAPSPQQMTASEPRPRKAPVQAAFGTSSGAAIFLRDHASL